MEDVYLLANGLGRVALRALGVRVVSTGLEHLPTAGPVLLAANHVGYADFVLLEKAAVKRGRYLRFLSRYDAWGPPGVGFAMDRMRHVPVDRAAPAAAYLRARALLREGEAMGIFPEGGLSHSYTVRPLMRGTAALARETGAPVVPAVVWGSQRLASVGDPSPPTDLTRHRQVDIALGPAIHVDSGADLTAWTEDLGHLLTGMLEGLQRLPRHRPRPGEVAEWYPAHLGGHAPSRRRARDLDDLPRSTVRPTWGPDLDAFA